MKLPRARHSRVPCGVAAGKHPVQSSPSQQQQQQQQQRQQRQHAASRLACQAGTLPGFGLPYEEPSAQDKDDSERGSDLILPNGQHVEQPASMYGLSVPQMHSLGITGNTANLLASEVSEDSLRASNFYSPEASRPLSAYQQPSIEAAAVRQPTSMRYGRAQGRGFGKWGYRGPPPDLPSLMLDGRCIWIGMPITSSVAELIGVELQYAQYQSRTEPIALYFNSQGAQIDQQAVASDTDAYSIIDIMGYLSCPIHTLVLTQAENVACMLAALGTKGYRAAFPHARVKMSATRANREFGPTADIMIHANELQVMHDKYVRYMARATEKTEEQIDEDLWWDRWFSPQAAIDYGILDRVIKCEHSGMPGDKDISTMSPEAHAARLERIRQAREESMAFIRRDRENYDDKMGPQTA